MTGGIHDFDSAEYTGDFIVMRIALCWVAFAPVWPATWGST